MSRNYLIYKNNHDAQHIIFTKTTPAFTVYEILYNPMIFVTLGTCQR